MPLPARHRPCVRFALLAAQAAVLTACPASPGLVPLPAPTSFAGSPFAQLALAGSWRYAAIFHGPDVAAGTSRGWEQGLLSIAPDGGVTAVSALASDGATTSTAPTPWILDADGFATVPGLISTYAGFHLKLDVTRTLAAATGTYAATSAALWILQRVDTTASFGHADVASSSWAYHRLTTGDSPSWEHGLATVDADGVLSFSARSASGGDQADRPSVGRLAVDPGGSLTLDADPSWLGVLGTDRNLLVATHTVSSSPARFALEVYVRTGQAFTQADLTRRGATHGIVAGTGGASGWAQGVYTVDATGHQEWVSRTTNAGQTAIPPPTTVVLAPDGTLTSPDDATTHATELFSKNGAVRTSTVPGSTAFASLGINLK
jgi:hypothetical protein